jgi:isopenicillin N synthase-like dioxygenase
VSYEPEALFINIGNTLETASGGQFKAKRGCVFKPPVDHLHEERLSLVLLLLNSSIRELRTTMSKSKRLAHYCRVGSKTI